MSDRLPRTKLYTAENGELQRDTGGSKEGTINDDIRKDRESRLLFQYDPEGTIRYYFYARSSGRPEQYIAEYETTDLTQISSPNVSERKAREMIISEEFRGNLQDVLEGLGYEIDDSQWESRAIDLLKDPGDLKRPEVSEDAHKALELKEEPEIAAPDMEAALWLLFNEVDPDKSVVISEGGYLEHRGQDDVLIQVDSMRREVEPIESTKEDVDEDVVENKEQEFHDAYVSLEEKARSRSHEIANVVSDALRDAGVTERLDIDIYSEDRSSEVRRRFTVLTFLGVAAVSVVLGIVFGGGRLVEAATRAVELGQPVYSSGVEIQSWWVFVPLGFVAVVILVAGISAVQDGLRSVAQAVTPGSPASERAMQKDAERVVDALVEIRRRESPEHATRLLSREVPRAVAVDEGSRDTYRRKNAVLGAGKGAVAAVALVGIAAAVLVFAFSYWEIFVQLLIVVLLLGVLLLIAGGVLSILRSSPSRPGGSGFEPSSDEGSADNNDYTPQAMRKSSGGSTANIHESEGIPWKIVVAIIVLVVLIGALVYFGFIR